MEDNDFEILLLMARFIFDMLKLKLACNVLIKIPTYIIGTGN